MEFFEKIQEIQCKLKVPKNLYNSFGKYNYRNAEGILEAVKPFLKKHGLVLTLSDEVINDNERYYVMATARITDGDKSLYTTAYAREAVTKKGMDDSQITGTASSYARKYALNGLFLLDDTKDADTDEYHNQNNKLITKTQIKRLEELVDDIPAMLNYYNIDKIENMTSDIAEKIIERKTK